jgi:hypothetical protein
MARRKPKSSVPLFEQAAPAKKPRRARKARLGDEMSEAQVQTAVVDLLARVRKPNVTYFHCPNGEARNVVTGAKLKRMGTRAGVLDLIIVIDGKTHGLELKRARGGSLSQIQREMHREMTGAGVVIETAAGIHEALDCLVRWKAIPPPNYVGH